MPSTMFGKKVVPNEFFGARKHPRLEQSFSVGEDSLNESPKILSPEQNSGTPGRFVQRINDTGERTYSDSDLVEKPEARIRRIGSTDETLSLDFSLEGGSATLRHYTESEIEECNTHARHSLTKFLSVLYCLLLLVLGFSFPIAELTAEDIEYSYYEGFFTYLFGVAIIYLIFTYFFLMSPIPRHREMLKSLRRWRSYKRKHPESNRVFDQFKTSSDPTEASYTSAAKSASYYLRMDAVFFGLGSMIFSGLQFGQFFEYSKGSQCRTINAFSVPILRFMFTFAQLYFLFLNVRIRTDRFTILTRFGLMHLVGTNMVLWVTSIIEETRHAYAHAQSSDSSHGSSHGLAHSPHAHPIPVQLHNYTGLSLDNETPVFGLSADAVLDSCRQESVIGSILQFVSPLLYPFIVEYSLICAAMMYVMWGNIGIFIGCRPSLQRVASRVSNSVDRLESRLRSRHRYTVDCKGAANGMFLGILTVVAMVISMVLFFFWVNMDNERLKHLAVMEIYSTMIILYVVTTIAVVVAFIRMRDFRFDHREGSKLDEVLLIASQMGLIVFNVFVMICGHHIRKDGRLQNDTRKTTQEALSFCASVFEIIQSTCQTIFLLDASHRRPYKSFHVEKRPGRQMVTFLLVSNFGMWFFTCTLEVWRRAIHPMQLQFYGFWPWMLISHITIPLTIFYRFHSSVFLSEVWKKSYKLMKQ